MTKRKQYIVASVVICALIMSLVDGVIKPHYLVKSLIKIILFLGVPLASPFGRVELKKLFKPKKSIWIALALGLSVYGVVLCGYFLLKDSINFSAIANNLTTGAGVNPDNFVFVALYISFINSLLEELFFRGFACIALSKEGSTKFAFIFSSVAFAFYHMGMTAGWFNIGIWILAMVGLIVGGCIFNLLDIKGKSIYSSWTVHMFANFAINTIGFMMFGII